MKELEFNFSQKIKAMKYQIGIFLLALSFNVSAQIKGNKQIVTQTFEINDIKSITINLYADIEIDCAAEEKLVITTDENIMDLISIYIEDGKLEFSQKEWIRPSQEIKIRIGAPALARVEQSTHETVVVKNINRSQFNAMALIGEIKLQGEVDHLSASGETGEVDARNLSAKTVNVNLWSYGKIKLASPILVEGIVKSDGMVLLESDVTEVKVNRKDGGNVMKYSDLEEKLANAPRFIEFKIKNNSSERIQCYVIGPKPDGKRFSYGFPMNPGQVRKKNWTTGSKVYKKSALGTKKLLVEIKNGDEGELVSLFK